MIGMSVPPYSIDSKCSAETFALACKAGARALSMHASGFTCKAHCS